MIGTLILIICIIASLALGYFGYLELSKDNSSKYNQINANIINVRLKDNYTQNTTTVGNTQIVNRITKYELWPQYQYTVNGKIYNGEYKLGLYDSISYAQNEVNSIMNTPSRKIITVYYEISNPSKSALGFSKNNAMQYFAGSVVLLILGLIAGFGKFTSGQPQPESDIKNVVIFNKSLFK
jgi:hypothetical protein